MRGARVATCTDPNRQISFALDQLGGVVGPLPHTTRYPARKGFDEFYGYGRLNAYKAVGAAYAGTIPPEAEITSPDWFTQVDPARGSFAVAGGYVSARAAYRCSVWVAPGAQAEQQRRLPPGVRSSWCDGSDRALAVRSAACSAASTWLG